jgi:hypothetical protein
MFRISLLVLVLGVLSAGLWAFPTNPPTPTSYVKPQPSGTSTQASTGQSDPQVFPFATEFGQLRFQSLYLASELTAVGLAANDSILALRYSRSEGSGESPLTNVRIRMAHTSATTATTWHNFNDATDLVMGPRNVNVNTSFAGPATMAFWKSFVWNGTSNVLIDFSMDGTTSTAGGGIHMFVGTAGARTIRAAAAGGYSYPFDTMTPLAADSFVPAVEFGYQRGFSINASVVPPPATEGQVYAGHALTAINGTPPFTWTVTGNNQPPPGLRFDSTIVANEFHLVGTPDPGTFTTSPRQVTVRVTDSASVPRVYERVT